MTKYITTTLPYCNSVPHIGHAFEFALASVISDLHKSIGYDVFLNVGIDEHGQKISQKARELGYVDIQDYCDDLAKKWKEFCYIFQIDYNNFYRTTDAHHKEQVIRYYNEINKYLYRKSYKGKYCIGCESFKTDKEIVDNECIIHKTKLVDIEEENTFFKLSEFGTKIKDILVNKSLSNELKNLLSDKYDLSVTRKNVDWGIQISDNETIYIWLEALLNYIFAIGYYDDPEKFSKYWKNSLQICGKDNLKFQAQIFQAILLANNVPQTSELLVHGTIVDENGDKMSKTTGNVIDPLDQFNKFGLSPLKYYLTFGLHTTGDSKYSESDLINLWNNDIVNKFGNLVSRTLHLIDVKNIDVSLPTSTDVVDRINETNSVISKQIVNYDLHGLKDTLNKGLDLINKRFDIERPFDKNCENYYQILIDIYQELKSLSYFYRIILKEYDTQIELAFIFNKKVILFEKIEHEKK